MAGRLLVGLVALAALLSGCAQREAPADDGSGGTGEDAEPGPYLGRIPGIELLPVPPETKGTVEGVVYDVTTGLPVDAVLTVACTSGVGILIDEVRLQNGENGEFRLSGLPVFETCDEVTYGVVAPGYTLAAPLVGGAIVAGTHQVVNAGLVPVP